MKKVKVPEISPTAAPAPLTYPAEVTASEPESNSNGGASWGKEKEREKTECLSGFIFMCNPTTKLECYQYRVFGLPLGKKEMVEEIKPGTKLFLFDFELKLLYGIYEATSAGSLHLEPAAFKGKFPAQVKFRIFKECLPLPESYLRHVIKENYTGSKFKQELSQMLVTKLLSSFRPLAASSSQPAPRALPNVPLSRAIPPLIMENQFKHTGRLPVMQVPYLAEMQYCHVQPLAESHPVPMVNYLQHGFHGTEAYVEEVHPTLNLQSLPATNSYYVANSQRPFFTEGVAHGVQQPPYSRYNTTQQIAPRDEVTILEKQCHQLPSEREALYHDNVAAYNSNLSAVAGYTSSVMQTQVPAPYHPLCLEREALYHDNVAAYNSNPPAVAEHTVPAPYHPLPLQREAINHDNVAAYNPKPSATAEYTSSVMQTQVPAPYHPLPLQRSTQYQGSSNPAALAQYSASVSQPQVPTYSSNAAIPAQHTSSVTQPQVLPHAPITNYYTCSVPDQFSR